MDRMNMLPRFNEMSDRNSGYDGAETFPNGDRPRISSTNDRDVLVAAGIEGKGAMVAVILHGDEDSEEWHKELPTRDCRGAVEWAGSHLRRNTTPDELTELGFTRIGG